MVQCNLTSTILIWQELTSLHQNDEIFTPKREGRVTIQSCDHLVTVFYRDHIFLTIPFCDSSTKSHCSMLIQCLLYQNMMLKLIWQELTYTSTLLSPPAKWDISYSDTLHPSEDHSYSLPRAYIFHKSPTFDDLVVT